MIKVVETLKANSCSRVIDMGCGSGALVKELMKEGQFTQILGVDVSTNALKKAQARLNYDELPELQKERLAFIQGSLVYQDKRFQGFHAIALVEVLEHIETERLPAVERILFEFAKPHTIILTTPNKDYNQCIERLGEQRLRHSDHRFEWSAREFQEWAGRMADRYGYNVRFEDIGKVNDRSIAPTQMGVFSR
ncbi:MAG: methyltransferase domain-containing protein [Proteobacteria bacterium]|nr:MAG: methyltransferase domain-containing protein [Pseudomonadota bacterium]